MEYEKVRENTMYLCNFATNLLLLAFMFMSSKEQFINLLMFSITFLFLPQMCLTSLETLH